MRINTLIIIVFAILNITNSKAQNTFENIDPKWDNYYKIHPSGLENNYQSSDFINVVETINFIPKRRELNGDQNQFKKVLLILNLDVLQQLMMEGVYYSITYKHDDYYKYYNMTYKPIDKETWDKYCPYLLGLMHVDGTISFK